MREDVDEEKRKRRNASSHLIERKENPVDRYFCHSVLPLCSVDRFCFLLSDLLKQIPQTPIRGLIRVQTYLCPRLDDTPPCCLSLSRHSNRLRSLHLHLKIYGVLRSTNPEANMQCYVRILVCSKDLLQQSILEIYRIVVEHRLSPP